jgi:uncharacterized membrane protein YvbJ
VKSNHFKEVSSKISNYSNILPDSKSKTTNINVLLNRVRLENKKNFKKKIFILIAASLPLLAVLLIILS